MRTLNRKFQLMACGLAAFGMSSAAHAGIVIDNFDGFASLDAPPAAYGTVNESDDVNADILGGQRDMFVDRTVPADPDDSMVPVSLITDFLGAGENGQLAYAEGPATDGVGTVTWDGDDGDPAGDGTVGSEVLSHEGLGGVDLTVGGTSDAILVYVDSLDIPSVDITLTVYTDATMGSDRMISLDAGILSPGTILSFPYSDFTALTGLSAANFEDVGAIVMDIDIDTDSLANDLILTKIETNMVPVPMAAWTGIPMLAGLGLLRKRMS